MDNRGRGLIFIVALMSIGAPVAKLGFEEFGVATLLVLRFGVASLFLVPKAGFSIDKFKSMAPASFAGALSILLAFLALDELPASVVPVLFALIPAMTLGWEILKGRAILTRRNLLALGVAFIGVALLADVTTSSVRAPGLGIAAVIASVTLYAIYGITSKDIQTRQPSYTNKELAFYLSLTTAIIATPIAIIELFNGTAIGNPGLTGAWVILYLVFFTTMAQFVLYQKVIKEYSATAASLYLYIQVPINTLVAAALLGEPLTLALAAGICLLYTSPSPRDRQKSRMPSSA